MGEGEHRDDVAVVQRRQPCFTFAVIGDTHIQPEPSEEPLLWPVYGLANGRAREVVALVNEAAPTFVVHLGDLVHPLPTSPAYDAAAERARAILSRLEAPLHCIPGNHDTGDKPFPAMPGCEVDAAGLARYRRHFGATFASFDHMGCHFVLIDAPILNSGLPAEREQAAWLEADLAAAAGRRVFLFTHYPPYVCTPDEPSNYDNLDEPARSWLLALIERHAVEAAFAGHVHNALYHRHGGTDLHVVPATSFFRQDYSELFDTTCAPENGRADAGKVGFVLVNVFEDGHIVRHVRSWGRAREEAEPPTAPRRRLRPLHPKERVAAPSLGVHLRHAWAEPVTFPYNGPMDEFVRKRARNDHALVALWEANLRRLRVPFTDLADPSTRARLAALVEIGHAFDVFAFGLPDEELVDLLARHRELVDAFEAIVPEGEAARAIEALGRLKGRTGLPVHLSKVESSARRPSEGATFRHFVSFGYRLEQAEEIEGVLALAEAREVLDGLVVRLALDERPWEAVPRMHALLGEAGCRPVVNVRLASDEPTEVVDDDRAIATRVAESVAAAFAWPKARVFLDTLVDQDRGNFPRHGLVDRRFNPRPASRVLRHLQAALVELGAPLVPGAVQEAAHGRILPLTAPGAEARIVLPRAGTPLPPFAEAERIVELESGEILERVPETASALLLVRQGAGQDRPMQVKAARETS